MGLGVIEMDDLLGVPNERLKDLLAELPEGLIYGWSIFEMLIGPLKRSWRLLP